MPVHGCDDITGDNASLGRGAICLWLGDKCTLSSLQAGVLCDVGSDRLNLKADPTAANKPLVLKLSNYRLYGLSRNVEGMPTDPPDGEKIAVLIPMTFPSTSKVGPPELPLFTGASIWMKSS